MYKLTSNQIQVGKPIPFDCYDSQGQLLLKKGLVVNSQRQVDFLLERGLYGVEANAGATSQTAPEAAKPPSPFQYFDNFVSRLRQMLAPLAIGPDTTDAKSFPERILKLAQDVQKLCQLDRDALLGAVHLNPPNRYTVSHPLHRAVVCELLGQRQAMPADARARLLAAALTADISMLKLQEDLFRQEAGLSAEQQQSVIAHPFDSAQILTKLGVTDSDWLLAVTQHHEKLNGKGYPHGIVANEISDWAKLLTLSDMYTAMVTPHAHRKALLSKTAMREMFLKRGTELDEGLAVLLIKELGVYPPGAFVRLQNGEVGIVVKRGQNPQAPLVKSVVGPRGAPLTRATARDTSAREFEISDVVDRDPIVQVDLHQLWDYEAA